VEVITTTWRIVEPVLDSPDRPQDYDPGTWGPSQADELIGPDGGWHCPLAGDQRVVVEEPGGVLATHHEGR
jgi:glucose-6-phosphate 1-dehydrogenase